MRSQKISQFLRKNNPAAASKEAKGTLMTKLTLYHLPYCGYCHKVRRAADRLGIALELRDISTDRESYQLLLETLGRTTVPVLRIEDSNGVKLMPESADIVEYLEGLGASSAA